MLGVDAVDSMLFGGNEAGREASCSSAALSPATCNPATLQPYSPAALQLHRGLVISARLLSGSVCDQATFNSPSKVNNMYRTYDYEFDAAKLALDAGRYAHLHTCMTCTPAHLYDCMICMTCTVAQLHTRTVARLS